jgi:hypothetical protein
MRAVSGFVTLAAFWPPVFCPETVGCLSVEDTGNQGSTNGIGSSGHKSLTTCPLGRSVIPFDGIQTQLPFEAVRGAERIGRWP